MASEAQLKELLGVLERIADALETIASVVDDDDDFNVYVHGEVTTDDDDDDEDEDEFEED
ncbi:MAG: hypothetical protein ACODAU_01220 [Myxococcota bacterium]